jgi:hypothetical protein
MTVHAPGAHEDHRHAGHEPDQVSVRGVAVVGMVLAAVVVGALITLSFLYAALQPDRERENRSAWRRDEQPPVDFDQPAQLRALREWEEKELHTYGWQDEEKSAARVPIERAMEMLIENGDPFTPTTDDRTKVEPAKQQNGNESAKTADKTSEQ